MYLTLIPAKGMISYRVYKKLPYRSRIFVKKFLLSFFLLEVLTNSLLADTTSGV